MNRYRKALHHLKSDFNESPINSMGEAYSLTKSWFKPDRRLNRLQDAETFYPDGFSDNPGEPFYAHPEGYGNGGKNSYARALKHVDMNRVKELHEEKIKQKKINEKIDEELIAYDGPEFCNWREETDLKESDWTPSSGSGPTNSSSQQFTYFFPNFQTGQPNTVTVSGLGGDGELPSSVTVNDGEVGPFDVPPPTYNQLAMQGYAPPLGKGVMKRNDDAEDLRKKQDKNLQKIKDTLKNLGTSWEEMRANNWALLKDDGTSIILEPITPGNKQLNWIDNSKITVGKKHRDAGPGQKPYKVTNPDGSVTMEFSEIVSVEAFQVDDSSINKQLDASQEFTQNVGADYMMDARVQDTSPTPAYYPTDQSTVPGMVWIDNPMSINGGHWEYDSSKTKVASVGLTQQDQEWLNGKQSLVNKLKIAQKFGGPAVDFAQWAINWAKGDYTPIKKFSPQMRNDVLDQITRTLTNRPGTSGAVQYHDYKTFTNNSTRLGLGRFTFDIGPNGVKVKDNFDVDRGGDSVGGALHMIPGLQDDATKITELGNRVGGGKGKIPIDVTIPWSEVSPQLQNRLDPTATIIPTVKRKKKFVSGRVSESTWDKLKKYR